MLTRRILLVSFLVESTEENEVLETGATEHQAEEKNIKETEKSRCASRG